MPNRLADSTSPYLLQHANNPVDWREWGEEAFEEARARDLPVLLSIGYAACHWCHVMAHESFEDEATAAHMNASFVCVKVDREERPDVDSVYMDATVAMTGHGGWPMTVFLDHDGRPFYAGTYFPPEPRHGMPSFRQLMTAISEAWTQRRQDVSATGQRIIDALASRARPTAFDARPDAETLRAAIEACTRDFDVRNGGFGGAPKFPPSMLLEFLLREAVRTGDQAALTMAERTLTAMARGGMYDQLGGGFARYSVDDRWIVPHFEKMLYDNALLLRVYAHWWRLTGSALAERIVRGTAEFMLRELRTPEGGFASALDADSEGVEGLFYAWTPEQLTAVLGAEDGAWAASLLEVTAEGTFEHGMSVLQLLQDPDDAARWERIRTALFEARAQRIRPGRDDKVVAAWNGLAIAALAEAGVVFNEPSWLAAAVEAADLLISIHLGVQGDDRLIRTSRDGMPSANGGVLADYGSVAEGFLALAQATGEDEWRAFAGILLDVAIGHFTDGHGGFYDTADDAEALVRRPRDPSDNAEPSGWLAVANACVTYAALTGVQEYRVIAERALGVVAAVGERAPRAVGWGLAAASALLEGPVEVAIIGDGADAARLHRIAMGSSLPGTVVAWGEQGSDQPLLRDRMAPHGQATAYVCRGFVCELPTSDAVALAARLRSTAVGSSA